MKVMISSILLIGNSLAFAGGSSAWAVPTQLDVVRNEGILVYGAFGNPANCTVGDRFFIPINTVQYAQLHATILMAMAAGKEIAVHLESCGPLTWYTVPSVTYSYLTTSETLYMRN
jgi:hypothetical protein